ncbi:MAG: low specificity L-threonine aldolase [Propionibacterium sp.]|nr:MAG: low specificity L-threonine aldolase [Propionibacterium sp.]
MIDLRSDTVTKPSPDMLAAMTATQVGDDVYVEDPTINAFEARVAELLGHEAALFCPTGSLANLLGIWLHTSPGTEVLCDRQAHIARAEMGAHAALHGVTMRTWNSEDGMVRADQVADLIAADGNPFLVQTACVEIENTHNFAGGVVQPLPNLQATREVCRAAGVRVHLDGARMWHASVETGVSMAEYGACADSVSVCFSKALGAPVGSILASTRGNIDRARVQRKRLGAGWRQAGVLAAAAEYALDHHLAGLQADHQNARLIADALPGRCRAATNIVVIDTGNQPANQVVATALTRGVALSAIGEKAVRAVTHRDVSAEDCAFAGRVCAEILLPS